MIILDTSNWPTPDKLFQRNIVGESWDTIAESLGASRAAVTRYARGLRFLKGVPTTRDLVVASDREFTKRMHRAINAGKEHPHVGIKIDTTATTARFIKLPPMYSGCGSPAAYCAEIGDGSPERELFA
jgi:hypothetical protein